MNFVKYHLFAVTKNCDKDKSFDRSVYLVRQAYVSRCLLVMVQKCGPKNKNDTINK